MMRFGTPPCPRPSQPRFLLQSRWRQPCVAGLPYAAFVLCAALMRWITRRECRARWLGGFLLGGVLVVSTIPDAVGQEISNTKSSGPVSVTTKLSPSEPTIGDEIEFTIEVTAAKDVEVLMPEFGEALERYSIGEFVPRQQIEPDGTTKHLQKYTLQPFLSGEQAIPPILIEFVDHRPGSPPSPDDFDAYEILTDRIDFTVASAVLDEAGDELRPPLGELELPAEGLGSSWWLPVAVVAGGLVLLLGVLFWGRRWRQQVKRANAYELARTRLERLLRDRNSPQPMCSIEQFFVEISAIVRRYLEDRFELRAPELTTDEFLQLAAGESGLSREHQGLLSEFLQQADAVKFAGVQASAQDVSRSSELALQFLEETRENAPEVEVNDEHQATRVAKPGTPPNDKASTAAPGPSSEETTRV